MTNEQLPGTGAAGADIPAHERASLEATQSTGPQTSAIDTPTEWRRRSSMLTRDMARAILRDPRIQALSPKEFGALMLMRAHQDCGSPLQAKSRYLAASLNLGKAQSVAAVIGQLTSCTRGFEHLGPLVIVEGGELVVQPFGTPKDAKISQARANAATLRWQKTRERQIQQQALDKAAAELLTSSSGKRKRKVAATTQLSPEPSSTGVSLASPEAAGQATPSASAAGERAPEIDLFGQQIPSPGVPYEELCALYNSICTSLPKATPHVRWSHNRRSAYKQRWEAHPDIRFWREFFQRIEESDFLTGRRNGFKADADWIANATNFIKIIEGRYDNNNSHRKKLFGGGANQFQAGTYGGHQVHGNLPWEVEQESASDGAEPSRSDSLVNSDLFSK